MQRLLILHSSDLHGEIKRLARIATAVEEIKAQNPDALVLYMDAGDSQDKSNRLSKKTKGVAMYRLLNEAGCNAFAMSNKCMKKYGMDILEKYAEAANSPILNSNIFLPNGDQIAGTSPSQIIDLDIFKLGVIGVTADEPGYVSHHELVTQKPVKMIRQEIERVREQGADAIVLLSHMGIRDDLYHASVFNEDVSLILGGHSHYTLENGRMVDSVGISHVGAYGKRLGVVELLWDNNQLRVVKISTLRIKKRYYDKHPRMKSLIDKLFTEID